MPHPLAITTAQPRDSGWRYALTAHEADRFTRLKPLLLRLSFLTILLLVGIAVGLYGAAFGERTVLLLGAPLVVPLAATLFIKPQALFFVLIASRCALDPILESARFSSSFGLGAILNVLIVICAFWMFVQRADSKLRQVVTLWLAPFLVMAFGVTYAPDVISALKGLIAFTSYFAVFIIGFILAQEGQLRKLLQVILLSSVVPLFVSFYQLLTGTLTADNRLAGTFTHPNIYAFYCLLVLIVLVYYQKAVFNTPATTTSKFNKIVSWILVPSLLISIIMTQTRSSWLALLVIGVFYGVIFSRKILIWLVAGLFVSAFIPAVQDRVLDLFTGNEVVQYAKLNSFAWRQYIWESGLNWMSPSRYLLGYGAGSFYYYSVDFFPMSGGVPFGAHNVFVERFFDGGMVAIAVFAIFFACQFTTAFKLIKYDKFSALVYLDLILSYLVLNTSDNVAGYLAYNWYYWVVAGAIYSYAKQVVLRANAP